MNKKFLQKKMQNEAPDLLDNIIHAASIFGKFPEIEAILPSGEICSVGKEESVSIWDGKMRPSSGRIFRGKSPL